MIAFADLDFKEKHRFSGNSDSLQINKCFFIFTIVHYLSV